MPVAEQTGLMDELGEFVLRRALADAIRWPNLSIAVNLSPVQVREPGLLLLVSTLLHEVGSWRRSASCSKSPKAC